MTDVTGIISANGRINVKKNGTSIGTRRCINFIEGNNISMSITDDPTNEKVDVNINSSGTGGGTPSTTVVSETNFGQTPNSGSSNSYSRGDHTHGTPVAPTGSVPATTVKSETTFGLSPSVGTSTNFAREDHTHGSPPNPGGGGAIIPSIASYIITTDGTIVRAINGLTGSVDYSGSDASVIQSAINASKEGETIYIRPGTYAVNKKISWKPVNLLGAGRMATRLVAKNGLNDVMIEGYGWRNSSLDYFEYGKIAHMTLDGNRTNQTSGDGIVLAWVKWTILEDLHLEDIYGYGIKLLRAFWTHCRDITMYQPGNGVRLGEYAATSTPYPGNCGTGPCNLWLAENLMQNIRIQGESNSSGTGYTTNYGIHIANSDGLTIINSDTSSCNIGVLMQQDPNGPNVGVRVWRTTLMSPYFEDNGGTGPYEIGIRMVSGYGENVQNNYIHEPVFSVGPNSSYNIKADHGCSYVWAYQSQAPTTVNP